MSLERAKHLGCTTVQIFSHNPRQWLTHALCSDDVAQFKLLRDSYDINPVYIHSSYLINLCAEDTVILDKSIRLLVKEIELADVLGADYVILHTGSASRDTKENAHKRAVEALRRVLRDNRGRAEVLLENTAGERGDVSSHMVDLARLMEGVNSASIGGICLDTCHAFQAGYDIATKQGMERLAEEIGSNIGLDRVRLIHLNDSKRDFNAGVDRHEHIGRGSIGEKGLRQFVNYPPFRAVPIVLETPKKDDDDDRRNLRIVRRFLGR